MFQSGELNPNWKGGKTKTVDGYIRFSAGENRYKLEHRVIWERERGPIPEGFDVHHKNEQRADNRIENFELKQAIPHRTEVLERVNKKKKKGLTQKQKNSYYSSNGNSES